jgi:[FeFe] hydrogenase H-cluster maturation GTPase HydF
MIMSLNETPNAERIHIGIFGNRNAGKSSLVNAITGQRLAVVSETAGTTTDPVSKAMELLPLGPVLITDTPGYDDEGSLGRLRVEAARKVLYKTDIALLVVDAVTGLSANDKAAVKEFDRLDIPYIIVYNKSDLLSDIPKAGDNESYVSAINGTAIYELKEMIGSCHSRLKGHERKLVADFISEGDVVLLVIPIDESAPKGRLILPQQQAIRDILDAGGIAIEVKEDRVRSVIDMLPEKPSLVITDSQVFGRVSSDVPEDIRLTSFSILMARYKGFIEPALKGAMVIDTLAEGDRILISEGCTHHRQCNDIGTVKLPAMLQRYCGCSLSFDYSSGGDFPDNLKEYRLVIHCGGCMLSDREIARRIGMIDSYGVPVTNYGTAIAHVNGILERSTRLLSV